MRNLSFLFALFASNLIQAQLTSFLSSNELTKNATGALTNVSPPDKLTIGGIGSLNDLPDSSQLGASLNVLASFRFLDVSFKPGLRKKTNAKKKTGTTQSTMKNVLGLHLNYNLNATLESLDRDSVMLASIAFQEGSQNSFTVGTTGDVFPMFFGLGFSRLHPNPTKNGCEYFELLPTIDYSYSRWDLKTAVTDTANTSISELSNNRVETSQWNFGARLWYTWYTNENMFGFMFYPHYRTMTVTDGTVSTFRELFNSVSTRGEIHQNLSFWGATIALQLNKVQFSFQVNELMDETSISDNNVSGGIFQLKMAIGSEVLTFN